MPLLRQFSCPHASCPVTHELLCLCCSGSSSHGRSCCMRLTGILPSLRSWAISHACSNLDEPAFRVGMDRLSAWSPQNVAGPEKSDSVSITQVCAFCATTVPCCVAGNNVLCMWLVKDEEVGVMNFTGPLMTMDIAVALSLDLFASVLQRAWAFMGGGGFCAAWASCGTSLVIGTPPSCT